MLAPPTEQGLPGDMTVGPSELSSGRGGRSTEVEEELRVCLKVDLGLVGPSSLTHVIHDGCLRGLAVQVHHRIHAGRDVPGCWALSDAVNKEVKAAVFFPHHAHRITSLQEQ